MHHYDRTGAPITMAQWFWLNAGGDPARGPDALSPPPPGFFEALAARDVLADVAEEPVLGYPVHPAEALRGFEVALMTAEFNDAPLDPAAADAYRLVAYDRVGPYGVSTVWLGLDYGRREDVAPVIFETMVFAERVPDVRSSGDDEDDGRLPLGGWRYTSEAEALAGHQEVLAEIRATYVSVDDGLAGLFNNGEGPSA